ncbi:MAG: hypothetical protein ABW098_04835 [Candidatus Thiodiazotropha sp.]
MIIQLIYWQSFYQQQIGERSLPQEQKKNSAEEERAFIRSLNKHSGRHYIRFS